MRLDFSTMHLAWSLVALLAATAVGALPACSMASDTAPQGTGGGVSGPNATVGFQEGGTLTLAPGESRQVHLVTSPAASYELRFALLGNALDASLDKTIVVAGSDGHADVMLRAPNGAT